MFARDAASACSVSKPLTITGENRFKLSQPGGPAGVLKHVDRREPERIPSPISRA